MLINTRFDVQETLVDTKALVDTGVLAKPFKEQFEEVKQVVDRIVDMTDLLQKFLLVKLSKKKCLILCVHIVLECQS